MTTTEVEKAEPKQKTLAQLINDMKPEIQRALPRHLSANRMARIAVTVLRQTPALARCTPESFLGALMTASQLGLEPGPLGEAYLVPFNTKTGTVCQFIPGYRGLIKLAWQSDQLVDIWSEMVYEGDHFVYEKGLDRKLEHKPGPGDRGKPIHVYAVAKLKSGGTPFVVGDITEDKGVVFDGVNIRARSKASGNGPWVSDFAAMAKKTAVKQLAKWLPLTSEFSVAMTLDGSVRTDIGAELIEVTPQFVEGEVVEDQGEEG